MEEDRRTPIRYHMHKKPRDVDETVKEGFATRISGVKSTPKEMEANHQSIEKTILDPAHDATKKPQSAYPSIGKRKIESFKGFTKRYKSI